VPPGEAPLFIAVLSARGEVEDRVAGLDLGATDYMGKPFSFDELAARVRAHLRRPGRRDATQLEGAGIVLDLLTRTVTRDGTTVELSPREFGLLAYSWPRRGGAAARGSDSPSSVR
jgi:DNA-binding response OmpR family regulator